MDENSFSRYVWLFVCFLCVLLCVIGFDDVWGMGGFDAFLAGE